MHETQCDVNFPPLDCTDGGEVNTAGPLAANDAVCSRETTIRHSSGPRPQRRGRRATPSEIGPGICSATIGAVGVQRRPPASLAAPSGLLARPAAVPGSGAAAGARGARGVRGAAARRPTAPRWRPPRPPRPPPVGTRASAGPGDLIDSCHVERPFGAVGRASLRGPQLQTRCSLRLVPHFLICYAQTLLQAAIDSVRWVEQFHRVHCVLFTRP